MAYTIKITSTTNTEVGPTFKLNRNKELPLHEDIANLANRPENKRTIIANFGYQMVNAYVKLKDNKGWQLICDMKLSY